MSKLEQYEAHMILGILIVDILATYFMYRMWVDSRPQQSGGYHV